ncbi:hypothetical protein [Bacillus kexueae]|uniref:hypothetical protein n=1 Tax=Aeribacillus kexueae TaxID=2078952 RepID=UPI001FAF1DBD|nr:hypothetical protein [Bacillus kexueae]
MKIKFEHIFAFALLAVLSASLFIFHDNRDVVNQLIVALVGGFSAITAYFFTKHRPGDDD